VTSLPTDVSLFDVQITTGKHFCYTVPADTNAFLTVINGSITICNEDVLEMHAVSFVRQDEINIKKREIETGSTYYKDLMMGRFF
jgi:redox-sensitive bicupin YhaK (pirin superfamily)